MSSGAGACMLLSVFVLVSLGTEIMTKVDVGSVNREKYITIFPLLLKCFRLFYQNNLNLNYLIGRF